MFMGADIFLQIRILNEVYLHAQAPVVQFYIYLSYNTIKTSILIIKLNYYLL